MYTEIALLVDENGAPSDFFSAKELLVFDKDGQWRTKASYSVINGEIKNVPQLRFAAMKLVEELKECRIIAAKELSGIPYTVFDMAKFCIFTINDISDAVLDDILNEANSTESNSDETCPEAPVQIKDNGFYFLDLIKLQEKKPQITSKTAMKSFFEQTPFMELKLICSHLPPWIENTGDLETQKVSETEYIIRKIECRDCSE